MWSTPAGGLPEAGSEREQAGDVRRTGPQALTRAHLDNLLRVGDRRARTLRFSAKGAVSGVSSRLTSASTVALRGTDAGRAHPDRGALPASVGSNDRPRIGHLIGPLGKPAHRLSQRTARRGDPPRRVRHQANQSLTPGINVPGQQQQADDDGADARGDRDPRAGGVSVEMMQAAADVVAQRRVRATLRAIVASGG